MKDTRFEYPEEYDLPDASEWTGSRLGDYSKHIGIEPAADALRATDKYDDSGATVSVRLPNGDCLYVPDDLSKIRALQEDEPVAAWIIHGIAWDGTDWEYSEEVATVEEIQGAIDRFADALNEHRAFDDAENAETAPRFDPDADPLLRVLDAAKKATSCPTLWRRFADEAHCTVVIDGLDYTITVKKGEIKAAGWSKRRQTLEGRSR